MSPCRITSASTAVSVVAAMLGVGSFMPRSTALPSQAIAPVSRLLLDTDAVGEGDELTKADAMRPGNQTSRHADFMPVALVPHSGNRTHLYIVANGEVPAHSEALNAGVFARESRVKGVPNTAVAREHVSRPSSDSVNEVWPMLDVVLIVFFGVFMISGLRDARRFFVLVFDSGGGKKAAQTDPTPTPPPASESIHWSLPALISLTAYRFYTGFLSATWLPYLLAMEGEELWHENQSLFMGTAKLIYGATILTNPLLGRLGDQVVTLSHGLSRRAFVRAGITISSVGIILCLVSGRNLYYWWFILGIFLWRLGEAFNDVTTEALIPEMVGPEQFQLASAVKSASFLFGGLFGYALLLYLVDLHYSWLYYSYAVGMVVCAWPALFLLGNDKPMGAELNQARAAEPLCTTIMQAYTEPPQYEGGYARFALATFVFSLGTSPMFFLLLMVRDMVGIGDVRAEKELFSKVSITFLLSAAVASVLSGIGAPKPPNQAETASSNQPQSREEYVDLVGRRWRTMVILQISFGVITMFMPVISCFHSVQSRTRAFYICAAFFGFTFGCGYSRMQEATWLVLPTGDRGRANAMGFNTMTRLLGIGIGNFAAGLMLDCFYVGHPPADYLVHAIKNWGLGVGSSLQVYSREGYAWMCLACAICIYISGYLTATISLHQLVGVSSVTSCNKAG
jgi:MFS family permease